MTMGFVQSPILQGVCKKMNIHDFKFEQFNYQCKAISQNL